MKQAYVKGTDIRIIGTAEYVPATALIDGFNADGDAVHEGTTEIDWDGQETKTGADGRQLYVDVDGTLREHSELEFRDDAAEEATACSDCGAQVDHIIGCPDGAEICQDCFDAGHH